MKIYKPVFTAFLIVLAGLITACSSTSERSDRGCTLMPVDRKLARPLPDNVPVYTVYNLPHKTSPRTYVGSGMYFTNTYQYQLQTVPYEVASAARRIGGNLLVVKKSDYRNQMKYRQKEVKSFQSYGGVHHWQTKTVDDYSYSVTTHSYELDIYRVDSVLPPKLRLKSSERAALVQAKRERDRLAKEGPYKNGMNREDYGDAGYLIFYQKNGKKHGKATRYDKTGKRIIYEEYYRNGKFHGRNVQYDDKGRIKYLQNYKDGKLNGLYESYEDGVIDRRVFYKNGKQLRWEAYKKGKLVKVENYKN